MTKNEGSTTDKQSPKKRNTTRQNGSIGKNQIVVPKDINNNEDKFADRNQETNTLPEETHGIDIIPDDDINAQTEKHKDGDDSNNVVSSPSDHKSVPKNNEAKESDEKAAKRNYTTKDPKCKFDKELLKEKTYSLRSSQRPKKRQDGDDSKDLDWAPNKSDLSNSQDGILIDGNKCSPKKKIDLKRKHQNVVPKNSTNDTSKQSKKNSKRRKRSDQMQHPCEKCGSMFDKYLGIYCTYYILRN